MITALYPGSFDPLTNGHIDIIKRGKKIFDRLVIGIGINRTKTPLFTNEERFDILTTVLTDLNIIDNIDIVNYEGLLMDFAKAQNAQVVVRGLRAVSDFEYEFAIAQMNKCLNPSVETVFMMASEQYSFISSALIKEVAKLGGDVSAKIHPYVFQKLKEKFGK